MTGDPAQLIISNRPDTGCLLVVASQADGTAVSVLLAQESLVEHRTCSG